MKTVLLLLQFFTGVILALAVIAGGGVVAAFYFAAKLTAPPERPVFEGETAVEAQPKPKAAASPAPTPTPAPAPSPTPEPAPTPTPPPLPENAYLAWVTWPEGLILRDRGSYDATPIGGLQYREEVFVLELSEDEEWERVRVSDGGQEGWVKAGNTESVE